MHNHFPFFLAIGAMAFSSLAPGSVSASSSVSEVSRPNGQNAVIRTTDGGRDRISGTAGVSAGGGWGDKGGKEPLAPEPSVIHTPYFEYNYISIGEDDPAGPLLEGHQHVYALGYELSWDSGLMVGLAYEYGDRRLEGDNDFDFHTLSGYASVPITGPVYAFIVGGFSEGTELNPVFAPFDSSGDQAFVNPGIGFTKIIGSNLTVNASVSYLYYHSTPDSPVFGESTTDQIVAEASVRYNVTDSVYVRGGIQYNGIIDTDFAPGVIDEAWWRSSVDVGTTLANGLEIYGGWAYDFSHNQYDTHTARFGVMLDY